MSHEKYNSRFVKQTVQKGGGSIGVWECFSFQGLGQCCLHSRRINLEKYVEVLENM